MSYDAVSLAIRLAGIHDTAPFAANQLTDANGFSGIDGIVRLRPGGLNERGLAVQEMTANEPRQIRPAPMSFVAFDRHMRAALALAERLQAENPDRNLDSFDGLDTLFDPPQDRLQGEAPQPVAAATPESNAAANPSLPSDQLEAVSAPQISTNP